MKRFISVVLLVFSCWTPCVYAQWTQTGGPASVHLNVLAIPSTDTIFAGTEKGVLRSTNGGDTWERIGLPNERVNALVCAPGGYVVAGTETDVYRSIDGGVSWIPASNGLPRGDGVGRILSVLDVHSSGDLFAVMDDWPFGLYRSRDLGDHWTEIIIPGRPSLIAAIIDNDGRIFLENSGAGLFRSTDRGATWAELPTSSNQNLMAASPGGILYAMRNGDCAMFRSTDHGDTWDSVSTGVFVGRMLALSRDTLIARAEFGKVVRSTNGAKTWSEITCWNEARTFQIGPGGVIFGGGHSIYRSSDRGASWTVLDAPGWSEELVATLTCSNDGRLYAGGGSGLYSSTDGGDHWKELNIGGSTNYVYQLATNSLGHLFAVENYEGMRRSRDHGEHWVVLGYRRFPTVNARDQVFAEDAVTRAIIRSSDGGESWEDMWIPPSSRRVRDIAIDVHGHVIALIDSMGIIRSTDDGATWDSVNTGLPVRSLYHLATSSRGDIFAGRDSIVFRSVDDGSHWTLHSTLPHAMATMLANANGELFVATYQGGVFRNGAPMNDGLGDMRCNALAHDSMGSLFVGTSRHSVFRSVGPMAAVISVASMPSDCILEQNFPNPFNPVTTIRYTVGGASGSASGTRNTRLVVYDLLGREVAMPVNESKPPGTYLVEFDATRLTSGVYFYRLQSGDRVQVRTMFVIR